MEWTSFKEWCTYEVHENCPIFKTCLPPLSMYVQDLSNLLSLGVQFQTNAPSPNNNQSIKSKHNQRVTIICYQVLHSGRLSFSLINPVWLSFDFFSSTLISFYQASLSAFSWVILLYVQLSKNITKCLLFTIIHIFSTDFESDCFLCTGPPCMWTTEIKTKTKPSYFTFKLSTRSIVRFSPQTMKWYH